MRMIMTLTITSCLATHVQARIQGTNNRHRHRWRRHRTMSDVSIKNSVLVLGLVLSDKFCV